MAQPFNICPPGVLAGNIFQVVIRDVHAGRRRVGQRPAPPRMLKPEEILSMMFRLLRLTPEMPHNIHDNLNRRSPPVTVIVAATANEVAALAMFVPLKRRKREGGAEQDAAAVGKILEQRVFNAVIGAAVNGAALPGTATVRCNGL